MITFHGRLIDGVYIVEVEHLRRKVPLERLTEVMGVKVEPSWAWGDTDPWHTMHLAHAIICLSTSTLDDADRFGPTFADGILTHLSDDWAITDTEVIGWVQGQKLSARILTAERDDSGREW